MISGEKQTSGIVFADMCNNLDASNVVSSSGPGLEEQHLPPLPPTSLPPLPINREEDLESSQADSDEDHKMFQIWAASCYTHCSVVTVMEYCGQFIKIEVNNPSCTLLMNFLHIIIAISALTGSV